MRCVGSTAHLSQLPRRLHEGSHRELPSSRREPERSRCRAPGRSLLGSSPARTTSGGRGGYPRGRRTVRTRNVLTGGRRCLPFLECVAVRPRLGSRARRPHARVRDLDRSRRPPLAISALVALRAGGAKSSNLDPRDESSPEISDLRINEAGSRSVAGALPTTGLRCRARESLRR